jgi:cholera toxin transcriptional activator
MAESSTREPSNRRYRFGIFEVDAAAEELRRNGMPVKLSAQPLQVLLMLLDRRGDVLTREEISRELWPDGTFVDYEHGVNSAVNRIREALGDDAANPRFIQTLARRGYRFLAPVERIEPADALSKKEVPREDRPSDDTTPDSADPDAAPRSRILSTVHELPKTSNVVVQTLFTLFQLMYLGFYIGALANLAEIGDLLAPLPKAGQVLDALVVSAAVLIPVRAFLLCAALFRAPGFREKLLRLWTFLLVCDELWALSPFLLQHHINFGLALACTTLLVYSPFAQRSLVLMGAGAPRAKMRAEASGR